MCYVSYVSHIEYILFFSASFDRPRSTVSDTLHMQLENEVETLR